MSDLLTALIEAKGETALPEGEHPFAQPLTKYMRKEEPTLLTGRGVVVNGLTANGWQNVTLRGITFTRPVFLEQCKNVVLEDCDVIGSDAWDQPGGDPGVGVRIKGGRNVIVRGNRIAKWSHGVSFTGIGTANRLVDFWLEDNRIENIRWDGIRCAKSVHNYYVRRNYGVNFFNEPGAHRDFGQAIGPDLGYGEWCENVYDMGETGARRQFLFLANLGPGKLNDNTAWGALNHPVASVDRPGTAQKGMPSGEAIGNWVAGTSKAVNVNSQIVQRDNVVASLDDRAAFEPRLRAKGWLPAEALKPEPLTLESLDARVRALEARLK